MNRRAFRRGVNRALKDQTLQTMTSHQEKAYGLIMGEAGDEATVRAMTAGQVVALARLQGVELSPLRVFHL